MSFILDLNTARTIKVIVSKDNSIKHVSEEIYQDYLKDLDENKLDLKTEPTRFIMKVVLPYKDTKRVMNSQMSFEDGKAKVNVSYILDEVRCSLTGMEGEGSEAFKKDSSGYPTAEVINTLYNAGVLMDLFTARQNASGTNSDDEQLKKS